MPDAYAVTFLGDLFIANGMDPPMKWDGLAYQAETIGVAPPTTPVAGITMAFSGRGGIVGKYVAYVRFLDKNNNPSNLSPVSAEFTAAGDTGTITGASFASPITITSAAHGLATGDTVKISGVGGNTSANGLWLVTVTGANTFTLDDSGGNNDYSGGGTWQVGTDTVTYSGVPLPTQGKVTRRQILRNTDGQAITFYVDVDTDDLTSTSFSSTNNDEELANQTAVPLLDSRGGIFADQYSVPPSHKKIFAAHQDRMFLAGQEDYDWGHVKVTNGSTTVTGVGTAWTASLAGRFLYVRGATEAYEIASINTSTQTITLANVYVDSTDKFAEYAIRPAEIERRLVYYTQAGLPEAWPATNALEIAEDGDEITGLMAKGSYLYIMEKRHIYRLTFQTDPARDGAIFLASNRGCINHRCWVLIGSIAYMLDEQGIHSMGGEDGEDPVSQPIQDLFRPESGNKYSINWNAQRWFHAIHYPPQEVIRWFITMAGGWYPKHALAYNYRLKRWWIEEYRHHIGASCAGNRDGVQTAYLGCERLQVLQMWIGHLDVVDHAKGTTRGKVASSTLLSLTDGVADFPDTVVGAPLCIVDGRGKGQTRVVCARTSATVLEISQPWTELPDTTSTYQLGGIEWRYLGGTMQFAKSEEMAERKVEIMYQRTETPGIMTMRLRYDFADEPIEFKVTRLMTTNNGVGTEIDKSDVKIDQTKKNGFAGLRIPRSKEFHIDGPRYIQTELEGVSNQDPFSVFMLNFHEVEKS